MEQIIDLIKNGVTFQELGDALKLNEQELLARINHFRNYGFLIEPNYDFDAATKLYLGRSFESVKSNVNMAIHAGSRIRFIAISDTHLGNVNDRLDFVKRIYEYAARQGIHVILHIGDLLENYTTDVRYRNMLKMKDPIKAAKYVINEYPKDKSITNYILGGNHDFRSVMNSGIDALYLISQSRPDMVSLGYKLATIEVNGNYIGLHHPFLHREETSIDNEIKQEFKQDKPSFVLRGHTHTNLYYMNGSSLGDSYPVIFVPAMCCDKADRIPGALDIEVSFQGNKMSRLEVQLLAVEPRVLPIAKVLQKSKN